MMTDAPTSSAKSTNSVSKGRTDTLERCAVARFDELDALLDVEERTAAVLRLGERDTDDELVEESGGTLDDVEVSGSDGVEGARNDAALHAGPRSPLVDDDVDLRRTVLFES